MTDPQGSQPVITIDGRGLAAEMSAMVNVAIVETDLIAPSTARLEFSDRDAVVLDQLKVKLGDTVTIRAAPVGSSETSELFVGRVYATEYHADNRGGYSIIVAYDAAYVLRQTRATRNFNDVTDSDVVNRVCSGAGVKTGTIDATDVTHPYLAQINESNWDFLQRRARANDRILYVDKGAVQFRRSPTASSAPPVGDRDSKDPLQLSFGRNLIRLHARNSAAGLVGGVEVRGWDPVQKKPVSATATPKTRSAVSKAKPESIGQDLGVKSFVASRSSITTQPECHTMALSAAEVIAAAVSYIDGQAVGDPRLIAGAAISIGVAGRFEGKYTISTARHVFDSEGYTTEFVLSGGHDRTMHGVLAAQANDRYEGVHPAIVDNISDPQQQGRVRLNLPWLDQEFVSNWARVSQIGAGKDRGILWFPEVGDEVLVAFVDGDVSHPVVLGSLYNSVDVPPLDGFKDGDNKLVDVRCLQTRAGHLIELSDVDGKELIRIRTGDGKIELLLDQANGKLVVTTDGDLELRAKGSTAIVSDGDLSIETKGKLAVKSSGAAEINSSSGLKLTSSGQVDVKGAMINLN